MPANSPYTLMGIVNVTPDSFSDGGQFDSVERAVAHALQLMEEGADILDIGGESTRPGAEPVSEADELARVIPVIEALRPQLAEGVRLSIDTRKPGVAKAAVRAGAHIWNDVSALTYAPDSLEVAAHLSVPVILMHAQGDPQTMQNAPCYHDVVGEVRGFLAQRIAACEAAGLAREMLITDPGIGFGKTLAHNIALMQNLAAIVDLGLPVLLGASRKRFIAALDRDDPAFDRLGGSIAAVLKAYAQGVRWFRVHDVAATRQALAVTAAFSS